MLRSRPLAFLLGGAMLAGVSARAEPSRTIELQTGDGPRQALVLGAGEAPRRTILVLHGANGSGEKVARHSGFAEAAARHGFAAVFPTGLGARWNYGPSVHGTTADDVAFLRALRARLVDDKVADPKRFYIAGISNGGLMTFKMLCSAGDLFAGAATIIADMPAELEGCTFPALPYVMVNGTADPMMPFDGGRIGLRHGAGAVLGALQTAALLARADACRDSPGDGVAIGDKSVVELAWKNCKPGTSVTFFRVVGGGHTVPGTGPSHNPAYGPTNDSLQAAEVILQAFDGQAR